MMSSLQVQHSTRYDAPRSGSDDAALIERFSYDPAGGYAELLERYTPVLLRMIGRHHRDRDEVMEVYTSICERLQANDYQVLRRFRDNSELMPWLSVVAANASRDRFRKKQAKSMPRSVLSRLDVTEQLVFRYHFYKRMRYEDIAGTISSRHGIPCTALEVAWAIGKINQLLSIKKRWQLLAAVNANQPALSIDDLAEAGFQPASEDAGTVEEMLCRGEEIGRLRSALESLSSEDQLMVALWFEQEMSAVQIAGVMHLESHKYVYTRLRTILNRLRKTMAEEA
jgi:DNA-directed RNA polymerase specialized sigma24 family protein